MGFSVSRAIVSSRLESLLPVCSPWGGYWLESLVTWWVGTSCIMLVRVTIKKIYHSPVYALKIANIFLSSAVPGEWTVSFHILAPNLCCVTDYLEVFSVFLGGNIFGPQTTNEKSIFKLKWSPHFQTNLTTFYPVLEDRGSICLMISTYFILI